MGLVGKEHHIGSMVARIRGIKEGECGWRKMTKRSVVCGVAWDFGNTGF